jgi:hypothetical protein
MNTKIKHFASGLAVLLFLIIAFGSGESETKVTDKLSIEFEQIGYFKMNNNRVFTYNIKTTEKVDKENAPKEFWDAVKKHGESQMNTSGKLTNSYYYLNDKKAPNITNMNDFFAANEKANDFSPVAVVYINPSGEKDFRIIQDEE